ncbi:hypothetical protein ONZ45_g19611 [Pleurotus djamor]|nr:hypothetical protein ONZ45_g19611 [Pleurotus djamor]
MTSVQIFTHGGAGERTWTINPSDSDPIPPERWIEALETVANAEWLTHRPLDPSDRMRRAYALLMQVILYLHRPQPEVEQYLVDFMQAEVTPESEIHRARKATTSIARVVLQDLASVPSNPLHADNPQVFAILGALMPLHDVYLDGLKEKEGIILDLPEWTEFWEKAQPILLELALKLDEAGFGLDKQEWEKDQ